MRLTGWKCTRCGNYKTEGCGMLDYEILLKHSKEDYEFVKLACPLKPVGLTAWYWKIFKRY